MMLRADTARWFELLTSREELGAALETLARTRSVQLQSHSEATTRLPLQDLRELLSRYETLARRHARWWPTPQFRAAGPGRELLETPRAALDSVQAWARAAEPVVAELEALAVEQEDLAALARLCADSPAALPRLDRVAAAGPVLASRLYLLPRGTGVPPLPPAALAQCCAGLQAEETFLLVVGPQEDLPGLDAAISARRGRRIPLPANLPGGRTALPAAIADRAARLQARVAHAQTALRRLDELHALAPALGDLARTAWLVAAVPELPVTEHFAWITGWCADANDAGLRAALDARGLHYLLHTPAAPCGITPPSVLRNPRWVRPFEGMTAMMGLPASGEADPSVIVAIIAPLMFGYMFGDVVQGAIIAVLGAWLGARVPALRLLVPGGLVAIVFGFVFGSAFAREDLVAPLWLHPLEQPLPVLVVALCFGAATLLLGLGLDALQRSWQGGLRRWLATDAGLVLAYLGSVGALVDARALWALPLGIGWTLLGAATARPEARASAVVQAAGTTLERLLQLAVNTLSFVRVGAFALAHAGLSAAVVGIAEIAGAGYWPVLVLGNVAIIALEGLVVSIQTTRLVLFEFFIRFLTARGRPFEPLAPPPALPGGTT